MTTFKEHQAIHSQEVIMTRFERGLQNVVAIHEQVEEEKSKEKQTMLRMAGSQSKT